MSHRGRDRDGCGLRVWPAGPRLLAVPTRVGEVGTGDEGSGRKAFASCCNPLQPLTVVAGSESAWADAPMVARAATETGREGREIAHRDRRDGVEGFERAWAGSGLVAVRTLRETGHELVYYQEDENGKWIEKSRHKSA